jgi:hypothetical protein
MSSEKRGTGFESFDWEKYLYLQGRIIREIKELR